MTQGSAVGLFAERYHPATGQWSSASTGLHVCASTLLPDGHVLMAGGTLFDHPHVLQILASAELHTP